MIYSEMNISGKILSQPVININLIIAKNHAQYLHALKLYEMRFMTKLNTTRRFIKVE